MVPRGPGPPRRPAAAGRGRASTRCPASSPPHGSSRDPGPSSGPAARPAAAPSPGCASSRPVLSSRCPRPSPAAAPPIPPDPGPPPAASSAPARPSPPPGPDPSPGPRSRSPARPVGPAERPPGPDRRDELGHLARERVPHEMRGTAKFDEALRRGPGRHGHGVGVQHQPDCPRGAAFQAAAVRGRGESLGPRHPRVSHYDPSEGSRPMADLAPLKYLRQGSRIVQSARQGTGGRPRARTRDRSEGCGG